MKNEKSIYQLEKEINENISNMDLKFQMELWNEGLISLPEKYIEHHKSEAEAKLDELKDYVTVHNTYMKDDGWMDGMKVLHVIVEEKDGTLKKLKWNDFNKGWMEIHIFGGSSIYHLE